MGSDGEIPEKQKAWKMSRFVNAQTFITRMEKKIEFTSMPTCAQREIQHNTPYPTHWRFCLSCLHSDVFTTESVSGLEQSCNRNSIWGEREREKLHELHPALQLWEKPQISPDVRREKPRSCMEINIWVYFRHHPIKHHPNQHFVKDVRLD